MPPMWMYQYWSKTCIEGALLYFGAAFWWDSLCRLRYKGSAGKLNGLDASALRWNLRTQAYALLTPLGQGLTEWARSSRSGQHHGKTAAELRISAKRTNKFWNRLGLAGLVIGSVLLLVAVLLSYSRIAASLSEGRVAVVGAEFGASAGALLGGWLAAGALAKMGGRLRRAVIGRVVGAALGCLGCLAGSVAGDLLGRAGAIIVLERLWRL